MSPHGFHAQEITPTIKYLFPGKRMTDKYAAREEVFPQAENPVKQDSYDSCLVKEGLVFGGQTVPYISGKSVQQAADSGFFRIFEVTAVNGA